MIRFAGILLLCTVALRTVPSGAAASDATTGAISGQVTDAETGEPLSFVNVILEGGSGTLTNLGGRFLLLHVAPGRYPISVSRIGYDTARDTVRIAAGDTTRVDIALVAHPIETDPIVVTATRKEQTARMAPASVSVQSRDELDNRQIVAFDDALETIPGVTAYRSAGISVQSMSIRGSSDVAGGGVGNRVLLLIDGRPALTSDTGGAFWSLVPVNVVERTEVVKGAFSSLYGSTAMGGVVNVITRRPDYRSRVQVNFRAGFFEKAPDSTRYTNSARLQSQADASISGTSGRIRYIASGNARASDGHAESAGFKLFDLYTHGLVDLSHNRNLEVTLGGGVAENDYPHSWLNGAQPLRVRDSYRDDRQQKTQFNADVHYWAIPGENVRYSSRVYYYRHDNHSFFNQADPTRSIPGNEPFGTQTQIVGNKMGTITQVDVYPGERTYVVAGIDGQFDYVDSWPDTVVYGKQQVNNFAVFAQVERQLTRRLTVTAGARDDFNHRVGGQTSQRLSPKVATVFSAREDLSVRMLYGQAFRAPTIGELYFRKELGGGIDFVPNPDLVPERMTLSAEVGTRWAPARAFEIDASAYRYEYEDLIYWEDVAAEYGVTTALFQVRNLTRAVMNGVDVSVSSRPVDALLLAASYNYTDAQDRSAARTDDLLAYRPRHTFAAATDLHLGRTRLHADARYRSRIQEVFLFPLQAPEAFWVFNANVRRRVSARLDLTVTVNNLWDAQYEEIERYRMPGRNWMFGASLAW